MLAKIKSLILKPKAIDPMLAEAYEVPGPEWIKKRERTLRYTPDIMKIEEYNHQRIFLCDELMSNHFLGRKLTDVQKLGVGFTETEFTLWKFRAAGKSIGPRVLPLIKEFAGVPKAMIQGEILAVNPNTIVDIDNYKENGYKFLRKRVKLIVPGRELLWIKERDAAAMELKINLQSAKAAIPCTWTTKAWMYIGIPEYWNNKIDGGFEFKPVQLFTPNNPLLNSKYYYFTQQEYLE